MKIPQNAKLSRIVSDLMTERLIEYIQKVRETMETLLNAHAAPSLISVCVERIENGEYEGNMWHLYQKEPVYFITTVDLLRKMEQFFDDWDFPQASTVSRSFNRKETAEGRKIKKEAVNQMEVKELMKKEGAKGTFVVHVKYRQNATWQGEVVWAEKKEKKCFRSALELLKLIDSALDSNDGDNNDNKDDNS